MLIEAGFDIAFECPAPTPMILQLSIHPSRDADLLTPDRIELGSAAADARLSRPFRQSGHAGRGSGGARHLLRPLRHRGLGRPDETPPDVGTTPIADLPDETLLFLGLKPLLRQRQALRFRLVAVRKSAGGARCMQAISDFVHAKIRFNYMDASPTRCASNSMREGVGVCRDFAHLAIALCRCMNIPARYCTGYLGDIGVPPDVNPGDFSAWVEVFLDGRWWTMDARHNHPRIGRIVMGRGRDAADVAMSTAFGVANLERFVVVTQEQVQHG